MHVHTCTHTGGAITVSSAAVIEMSGLMFRHAYPSVSQHTRAHAHMPHAHACTHAYTSATSSARNGGVIKAGNDLALTMTASTVQDSHLSPTTTLTALPFNTNV